MFKEFNFKGQVQVSSCILVQVRRNDRYWVFRQLEWNPDKNPFQTLGVENLVKVRRTEPRQAVEFIVFDEHGRMKPWIDESGWFNFKSWSSITIQFFDHKANRKQRLLVKWERRNGTLVAELYVEEPQVLDPTKEPLTAKLELPEELKPATKPPAEAKPENGDGNDEDFAGQQLTHEPRNGGKRDRHEDNRPKGKKPRRDTGPEDRIDIRPGMSASEIAEL